MVRSVSIPESEWTREDVALLLMSRHTDADMGPHGIPMSEATDPKNANAYAGHVLMDYAEKAKQDALDAARKRADKNASFAGVFGTVTRRPEPS